MTVTSKIKKILFNEPQLELVSLTHLPCSTTCEFFGLSFEELRKLTVVLTQKEDKPVIYLNNTKQIDLKAFNQLGIKIFLTEKRELQRSWKILDSFNQALPKILKLVQQANTLGASEIFLGTPKIDSYQFIGANGLYTGELSLKIIALIREYLRYNGKNNFEIDEVGKVNFALTKDEEKEVCCLWWKKERISNEETLIILEDEESTLALLKGLLEGEGYNLKVTTDFISAKNLAKQFNKNNLTLLLDAHIHDKVIDEFLVNYHEELSEIPIIVLTAHNDAELKVKLVDLGISAFILKDEDPRILLAWIKNIKAKRQN